MTKKLSEIKDFVPCCYDAFSEGERAIVIQVSKALGNEARLEIYNFLREHKTCFSGEIVDHLPLAQSTVSQHLKVLVNAEIILSSAEGTFTSYCINKPLMKKYYDLLGQMI